MKKIFFLLPMLCISALVSAQGTQVGSSAYFYSGPNDANIGGLLNSSLYVRHLYGKEVGSILADNLYLNYNTAKHVYVGGGSLKSDLIVNGNIKLISYAYQEFNVGNTKAYIWGNHDYSGAAGNFADDLVISANWQGVDSNTDNFNSSSSSLRNGAISVGRQGIRLFTSSNATSAPSQRMTILPTGLVGIGTTAPATKLEVKNSSNNASLIGSFNNFSGDQMVLRNENTTTGSYTGLAFVGNGNELLGRVGYKRHQFGNGRGEFFVSVDDAGVVTEALTIDKNGNMGVGVTDPTHKLEIDGNALVQGEVYSTKIKVSSPAGNWPDYVFEGDYDLMPLNVLSDYLKTNKHLPEVPSAKEVEAKGQDLGDIQATLLKKVEELTLYMIEQDKKQLSLEERLKKLEEENEKLRKELKK